MFTGKLMIQFSRLEEFRQGKVLCGEHLTSSRAKTKTIDFNLSTRVSNRMLNKNLLAIFLTMCHSFFYCNNSTRFESVLCMHTVKSRLFKKILKRRKLQALFCLALGWLHISANKKLKNIILLLRGFIKQEK